MTFVQHCEHCGAKIEIEDSDLEMLHEERHEDSDEPQQPILCESCVQQKS